MSAQSQQRKSREPGFMDRIGSALPGQVLDDEISHLQVIEGKLTRLPEEILKGIEPWVIAAKINDALQARIVESGIPEATKQLALLQQQVKDVAGAFQKSAHELIAFQDKVSDHSRHAVDRMESGIERSAQSAARAAEKLNSSFLFQYRWSLFALTGAGLVVGFLLGMLTVLWTSGPAEAAQVRTGAPTIVAAPQADDAPAASKKTVKKKVAAD